MTVAYVIGAGNVALDIAFMLARDPSELAKTDIADHALRSLQSSSLRRVVICARRGPEAMSFSAPEVSELARCFPHQVTAAEGTFDLDDARSAVAVSNRVDKSIARLRELIANFRPVEEPIAEPIIGVAIFLLSDASVR